MLVQAGAEVSTVLCMEVECLGLSCVCHLLAGELDKLLPYADPCFPTYKMKWLIIDEP